MNAPMEKPRVTLCTVCGHMKITKRRQRGVTHIEWVRVCDDCAGKIYKRNRFDKAPNGQLHLFAK